MTRITDRDILVYAGGAALAKYGTLVRRTRPPVYGGEEQIETYTRSGTSRASTAYAATLMLAASADRIPVWHYNPFTGERTPYPIPIFEPARTNLLLQSADFGTTWINIASSESVNQDISPEATTTVDRIIEDGTTGAHGVSQDVTITADAIHALSVWVRKDSTRGIVALQLTNTAFTSAITIWLTLSTGIVATPATSGTATHLASYVEDWVSLYRFVLVGSIGGGATTLRCRVLGAATTSSTSYTGDGASYFSLWGAQCEAAGHASSYIPTTTATVTRTVSLTTIQLFESPQAMQVYERLIYHGARSFARRWTIGTAGGVGWSGVDGTGGAGTDSFGHRNRWESSASDTNIIGGGTRSGDDLELLSTLQADGTVFLQLRANGGAITTSTSIATGTLPAAWGTPQIAINHGYHQALIIARGGFTMDDYAALLP